MARIIFDVGANDGSSTLNEAHDPDTVVYAFEPVQRMADIIRGNVKGRGYTNYHVVQQAVSDFDGSATFNVAGQSDWGCSSLLEFEENLDRTWPGRDDFKVTERVLVPVTRLDTFMAFMGIDHVDHLHIDAQGADLAVLRGLGDFLKSVSGGVLETASSRQAALYRGQHVLSEVEEFLAANGFKITASGQNDPWANELNVSFQRV